MTAVSTALEVLEFVARNQPLGVSEVARRMNLPKSTVQRTLSELGRQQWLEQEPDGSRRWVQSSKMQTLARHDNHRGLRRRAQPLMMRLHERFDENVHLAVLTGFEIVILERLESTKLVRPFDPVGVASPAHTTSSGLAILAWSEAETVDDFLTRGLPTFSDTAPTAAAEVRAELEAIRERGFSENRGQWRPELHAVAVPLLDDGGKPLGAVSVAAPAHRLPLEDLAEVGRIVSAMVNEKGGDDG